MPKNKLKSNEETMGYKPTLGSHSNVSDGPFKRPLFYVDTKPTAGAGGVLEQQPIRPMLTEDYTAIGTTVTEKSDSGSDNDDKKEVKGGDELDKARARRETLRRKKKADRINKRLDSKNPQHTAFSGRLA